MTYVKSKTEIMSQVTPDYISNSFQMCKEHANLVSCLTVELLVIEDYSIESQFQGKHVITLLPVLEEDNVHFVFKWFYTACVID